MLRLTVLLLASLILLSTGPSCLGSTKYKDCVIVGQHIWVLTKKGTINEIDTVSWTVVRRKDAGSNISLLTIDRDGKPVTVDKKGNIKRYSLATGGWTTVANHMTGLHAILFNSKNEGYVITDSCIKSLNTQERYFSKASLNHQISYQRGWGKPSCSFIDRNDNIWLGFGYGEWGGNMFVFSTGNKEFLKVQLDSFEIALWPIKSFFEDDSSVYITCGLQHMTSSGTIINLKAFKASTIINSKSYLGPARKLDSGIVDSIREWVAAEYIGPGAFNRFNNSIYFYSQHGIYRGKRASDLSKIEYWEKITTPKLHWRNGQPDAVGSPMNVLKLTILDEHRFILLTQNDGIGYFDGQTLRLVN